MRLRETRAAGPSWAAGRASRFILTACWLVVAGCRPPAQAPLRGGGRVDLAVLMRAHPAWVQVEALDAKIRRLSSTVPITLPMTMPPPIRFDIPLPASGSVGQAEREEIRSLIRQRVEQDYLALVRQLDREVQRYEAVQKANALARAEATIAARDAEFRSRYDALAQRYAAPLGQLILRMVALTPGPGELAFYPPEALQERAAERARVMQQLAELQARRDAELRALQAAYQREKADLRAAALAEAAAASRRYRAERLAQLQDSRDRQQVRLEQDLERALAAAQQAPDLPIPPADSVQERRLDVAQLVAQTNADARLAAERAAAANQAALRQLAAEREQLTAMIREATRALALAVASEQRLAIRFDGAGADPALTRRMEALIRQHWHATPAQGPPSTPRVPRRGRTEGRRAHAIGPSTEVAAAKAQSPPSRTKDSVREGGLRAFLAAVSTDGTPRANSTTFAREFPS
jgi:hypothetical protein